MNRSDGLDANAAVGFKALIQTLAREGKTIVYSSHILDVVERVCDRVVIIDKGKLLLDGKPDELVATHNSGNAGTFVHAIDRRRGTGAPRGGFRQNISLMNAAPTTRRPVMNPAPPQTRTLRRLFLTLYLARPQFAGHPAEDRAEIRGPKTGAGRCPFTLVLAVSRSALFISRFLPSRFICTE